LEPARLYLPTGHTAGVSVLVTQEEPAGQVMQVAVVLEPGLYLPDAHIICSMEVVGLFGIVHMQGEQSILSMEAGPE
jgi:hypothetical protein